MKTNARCRSEKFVWFIEFERTSFILDFCLSCQLLYRIFFVFWKLLQRFIITLLRRVAWSKRGIVLHGLQIYFFLNFLFNIRVFIINLFESRKIWLFTIHTSERSFIFHLSFMILSLFCLKFLITIILVNNVFLEFIKRLNNRSSLSIS
jgi:hypothetical protein